MGEFARGAGLSDYSPEHLRLMCHGRVVDTGRLTAALGWRPKFSTAAAFDDFVRARDLAGGLPAAMMDMFFQAVTTR